MNNFNLSQDRGEHEQPVNSERVQSLLTDTETKGNWSLLQLHVENWDQKRGALTDWTAGEIEALREKLAEPAVQDRLEQTDSETLNALKRL